MCKTNTKNGLFTSFMILFRVRILRQNVLKNEMIRPISGIVDEFVSFLINKGLLTVFIKVA